MFSGDTPEFARLKSPQHADFMDGIAVRPRRNAMRMWRPRRPQIAAPAATPASPERRGFLKRMFAFTAGGAVVAAATPRIAHADGDPFLGELALVPYNFAPTGWAFCDGQLLLISQNTALFSLLGTQFGGNGINTFALPDLRGRVPIHVGGSGAGPGLSTYAIGEIGGAEVVTLLATQMPAHTHGLTASAANGNTDTPGPTTVLAKNAAGVPQFSTGAPGTTMAPASIGLAGSNLPHSNLQPYLGLNWIIAMQGIFPSRA
jgi:microcystin-dependent protein